MIGIPILPSVPPKPPVIVVRISVNPKPSASKRPRTRPMNSAEMNSAKVGCSLTFMISTISIAMETISRTRNPVADIVFTPFLNQMAKN